MSQGSLVQINVSSGGVPKHAIALGEVTHDGLVGDAHAKPGIHGGPTRALSLYSKERIDALAAEGHPIAPGSTGENLTIAGLDWDALDPGVRLRLGKDVLIQITSYAPPCRTISQSFSDRRHTRIQEAGWSRLYAEVIQEGVIRPGDAVVEEGRATLSPNRSAAHDHPASSEAQEAPMSIHSNIHLNIQYVNLYVTDLQRSLVFFRDTLGLELQYGDEKFGYASFRAGPIRMGVARIDPEDPDQRPMAGRQSGIGFAVSDLAKAHEELAAKGVVFTMKPSKQPWGAVMAMFQDPDGNTFYLDELSEPA